MQVYLTYRHQNPAKKNMDFEMSSGNSVNKAKDGNWKQQMHISLVGFYLLEHTAPDTSPCAVMRAQQWDRECEIWPWRLAQYISTHWGSDGSPSTFLRFILPPFSLLFHHFPRHLCRLMSDLTRRRLGVTYYKLVLCQSSLWWGCNKWPHGWTWSEEGGKVHAASLDSDYYPVLFN